MFAIIEHAKPAAVVTYVVSASPTVILSMCVTPQEGGGFFRAIPILLHHVKLHVKFQLVTS